MAKPKLVIVTGYAGAGKSTAVKKFAKENDFVLITQDHFLFSLNAIKETKKDLSKEEYELATKNILCCFKNFIQHKKNIILEGALVSISPNDSFDLRKFMTLGMKKGYKVIVVKFIAKDAVRHKRMRLRNNVVPKTIDRRLIKAAEAMHTSIKNITVLDTTARSRKKVIEKLEELIL